MKILVTGMTAKQVGSSRAFQIALNSGSLVTCLKSDGHIVDWRPVVPGEDLSSYDRVVIYTGPVNALGSQHAYGVLWALATRPDAYLALDDWQTRAIAYAARSLHKHGVQSLFKPAFNRQNREAGLEHATLLHATLLQLTGDAGPARRCFTPMFRRGRPELLDLPGNVTHVTFDPTCLWLKEYEAVLNASGGRVEAKERRWVHAALLSKKGWMDNLNTNWPVLAFGNKGEGHERVPERELLPIIAGSWGLLSAPHQKPTSGWWRVRYAIAAACGVVLLGDKREMYTVYGEGFHEDPAYYERMSAPQLADIALLQRNLLKQQMMDHVELLTVINKEIRR